MTSQRLDGTPQMIEADIARQREELATTVQELEARLKVRARQIATAAMAGVGVLAGLIVVLKVRSHRNS